MADSNFLDLCLELQPLAQQFLDACNSLFKTRIVVTWRDPATQNQCKSEGLSNAGAGQSPHNCTLDGEPASKAFDFAIFDDSVYIKDGKDPRYAKAGEIAKSLGLVWGGDWNHPDYDHCELVNWKQTPMAETYPS